MYQGLETSRVSSPILLPLPFLPLIDPSRLRLPLVLLVWSYSWSWCWWCGAGGRGAGGRGTGGHGGRGDVAGVTGGHVF